MNIRRLAGSIVFCAAAFASIATSVESYPTKVPIGDSAPIPPLEVDARGQLIEITATARGSTFTGGNVYANLELDGPADSTLTISLVSEADPTVRHDLDLGIVASSPNRYELRVPAFETCEGEPCTETFRLEVRNTTPDAVVVMQGTASSLLKGDYHFDEVEVSVLPLGPLE